jgi:uncharacterized membrane protein
MNQDLIYFILGFSLGVFSIYDWYKNRESVSFRGPMRLIGGIFIILYSIYFLFEFIIFK